MKEVYDGLIKFLPFQARDTRLIRALVFASKEHLKIRGLHLFELLDLS